MFALWIGGAAQCATVNLQMGTGSWAPKLFETGSVAVDQAAAFHAGSDTARGATLAIGPWRAGRYNARYEYGEALPVVEGQVTGWYRTVSLLPRTAAVFVSFQIEGARPKSWTFELAPKSAWTRFAVPIRRPPPGAASIAIGVGLSAFTEGQVVFAGLTVTSEPYRTDFPERPPAIMRPAPPASLSRGESYRVVEGNGAWWLVSPQGKPLYSTGTDGPRFATESEGRKYFDVMRALSFNSLAGWTNHEKWGPLNDDAAAAGATPLVGFRSLKTADIKAEFDVLTPGNHAFPDPFDPRWESALREHVRRAAAPVRGKPWFVGFFADNEATHRDLHRHVYTTHCAAALGAFLEKRYGNIGALNGAWGAGYESFAALLRARPDPELRQGRMYEDFRLFERDIVRRYVGTLIRIIREEAPGHLVFSNRLMLDDVTEWMDLLDLYQPFDAIAINIYPANLSAGLNETERAIFDLAHRKTRKPILVPEWSVPALDSGLYDNPNKLDWSYREVVETQRERARQAAAITIDFFNLPYVVGAHWFIWKDIDNDARQANRGLFKASGEPWVELQESLAAVNRQIQSRVARRR